MKCEDYPCCGCGPEGCIDFSRTVQCGDCGVEFHPDQNTERFCYRCIAIAQIRHEERIEWEADFDESDFEDCDYEITEEDRNEYDRHYSRD